MLWPTWRWTWAACGGGQRAWPLCWVERTKRTGTLRAWVDGGRRSARAASAALLVWWPSGGAAAILLAADVEVWEAELGGGPLPSVPWLEAHAMLLAAQLLQLVPGSLAGGCELAVMDDGREEEEKWLEEVWSWLARPATEGAGGRRKVVAGRGPCR